MEYLGSLISPARVDADLIIDALLGYSLRGRRRGQAADWIRWATAARRPVLSLDTPSGLALSTAPWASLHRRRGNAD